MHVAIVHDAVREADAPDARDAIVQADAVARALKDLGHTVCRIACGLNLLAVATELRSRRVDLVFNLVESIGGQGRLIHLLPFCLDALPLPYSGARAEAMLLTSSKTMAKAWMAGGAIPTPAWVGPWPGTDGRGDEAACGTGSWIVKSVWEHASIGLGPHSLVRDAGPKEIFCQLEHRAAELGGACFAEHFIAGREFNLSLLAHPDGPQVLPPAEITFEGFTPEMPHIVDYRAKWDQSAFEYHHTPRRFAFGASDTGLLARLAELALRCWEHFGLRGYARVDFRVDEAGAPWVLEINANPCLAPDAGFSVALARAGIPYADAIGRIVAASLLPVTPGAAG